MDTFYNYSTIGTFNFSFRHFSTVVIHPRYLSEVSVCEGAAPFFIYGGEGSKGGQFSIAIARLERGQ